MAIDPAPESTASPFKGKTGLKRVWNALFYSIDGLVSAWRHESAFRQELMLAAVLLPVALLLPATWTQKAILCATIALVLIVELLNSAVEATIDRFGPEQHALSGRAKDIGSAAVLLSISLAALVWLSILGPRLPW